MDYFNILQANMVNGYNDQLLNIRRCNFNSEEKKKHNFYKSFSGD